jgi:multiple antibiotic resistance protein
MILSEYILLATSSLFAIVDPIATVPAFIAMTPRETPEQRIRMAKIACTTAAVVLVVFTLTGKWIFKVLGITLPAFQMAGSIVLLLVALDMLRATRSPVLETSEEVDAGMAKEDIAITPLAVPMLAGPGAITTAILLNNRAENLEQKISLHLCILAVLAISYGVFRLSAYGGKWLNPIALKITTRIMGLLLAAISMQFLFDALKAQKGQLF